MCIREAGWPLPHIGNMLQRIGRNKPTRFAKFDMTQGYYQAPLSESSKTLTAFISFMGVFEWERVPMGIKPAGPYFHKAMATEVLSGLIYNIAELYLDDLLCYANSDDELLQRLRILFQRFKEKNVTLNPDKCMLGMDKIEFVGHVIDKEGIEFSPQKLDGIKNFPLPITELQLKSFLGLANFFRSHVRNHSILVYPLQQLVKHYDKKHKHRKLKWTKELEQIFEKVKHAISDCMKLHFLDPDFEKYPVVLETDASDYGIGALLSQYVNDEKFPIMCISKSLDSIQLNWSTPEKECYAII
jgi:hypothetical protein